MASEDDDQSDPTALEDNKKLDLHDACERGDVAFLRKYIEEPRKREDFAVIDEYGFPPLHYAVSSRSYECVELLLSTNLIDVGLKSKYGGNALGGAIFNNSCNIIRLLLESDPSFASITPDFGHLDPDVDMYTEIMETIVGTLEKMRFPFANAFHVLNNITRNFRFWGDEEEKQIEIFEKLVALVLDETSNDFMERVCDAITACANNYRYDEAASLMRYSVAKWHMTKKNEHCDLVRKLLENPELGFDENVIFFLHSDIRNGLMESESDFFMISIIGCLLKVDVKNRDVIDEVLDILWPKANMDVLPMIYNYDLRDELLNSTSIEWLGVMRLGDKTNFNSFECFSISEVRAIVPTHIPFSTEVTADVFLTGVKANFKSIKHRLEKDMQAYPSRRTYLEEDYSEAVDSLARLDDDDELAKYCVHGVYRRKATLKSLCRAEIRKCLLQSQSNSDEKSFSVLLNDIKSLELPGSHRKLPKSLQQYLLFNYSSHWL